MSRYEYAAILTGILVGLALSNILTSAHKLTEARARVQWDWMAPTTAFSAGVLTLGFFWSLWRQSQSHIPGHYYFIGSLLTIVALCFLFLACAATLPDEVPEQGLIMRDYYFTNRKRFWTLFALCFATSLATWPIAWLRTGSLDVIRENLFGGILVSGVGLTLSIVSLLTVAPWWHRIAVAGSLIFFLVHYGPMQIG